MFGRDSAPWTNFQTAMTFQNNSAFLLIALIGCTPLMKIVYRKVKGLVCGGSGVGLAGVEAAAGSLEPGLVYKRSKRQFFFEELLEPAVNIGILIVSIVLLVGQTYNPFLYFRF